jgi:hypothetical protein
MFPHGVLFRQEEREMRQKLIESDQLDCVFGAWHTGWTNADRRLASLVTSECLKGDLCLGRTERSPK